MRILPKLLRFAARFSCSVAPFRYIPERIPKINNLGDGKRSNLNKLLLRRFSGEDEMSYFCALSSRNLSPEYELHPPFPRVPGTPYPVDVVGGCNGLLCLEDNQGEGHMVLWNPTTDHFRFLPPSSVQRPPSAAYTMFDCSGFGYHQLFEDYQVIRFVRNVFEDDEGYYGWTECHAELYSLKTNSWKEIPVPDLSPWSSPSAYLDGVFYWVADGRTDSDMILAYNFTHQDFSWLPFPRTGNKRIGPYTLRLVEFRGSLAALVFPLLGTEKCFDVWVLNNNSWRRLFEFRVPGVERPLGFWGNDEIIFEGINRELLLFNLATRELKNLGIYGHPDTMRLIPYVESTFPLFGELEEEKKEKEAEMKRTREELYQLQKEKDSLAT